MISNDIFKDSTSGLDLERIKEKIRSIWSRIIVAQYGEDYKHQKDDDEDYVSIEEYLEENQLFFPGDEKPTSEVDSLVEMLENIMDPKEELEPVTKDGKAPSYEGSEIKAHNERIGKNLEATEYKVKHISTSTPTDSSSSAKGRGTYDKPSSGKIAQRTDSAVKRSYAPIIEKIIEELLSLEERQTMGRKKQFARL
jgi:hypothetical protein